MAIAAECANVSKTCLEAKRFHQRVCAHVASPRSHQLTEHRVEYCKAHQQETTMAGDVNAIWDKADDLLKKAWADVDEFLRELERRGPAKAKEQRDEDNRKFLELQQRANEVAKAIYDRAVAGDPPAH
jgi:ElaB/YqjD/DUF883 family membrane-anchored ribosome-binding protein